MLSLMQELESFMLTRNENIISLLLKVGKARRHFAIPHFIPELLIVC